MYQIKSVAQTTLAKKLGGVPVFHDGKLKSISVQPESIYLGIEILSDNNERLKKNTLVHLKLNHPKSFSFATKEIESGLFTIHDLDVRKESDYLHLRLESIDGTISYVVFESIELSE